MKTPIVAILLVISVFSSTVAVLFYNDRQKASQVPEAQTAGDTQVTIPPNAVKISECIPFEGEHYVEPSKLPFGPIYTAYKGNVTGIEFMFSPEQVPGEHAAKMSPKDAEELIKKNKLTLADLVLVHDFEFDLMNYKYKTMGMNWSSPHIGLPSPHYDIHLFMVDKHESSAICPDSKLEDVYSPEVMENVQKYKIPFPSAPNEK